MALTSTTHPHETGAPELEVSACAISPDGRWIVSASSDGTVKVWDAATGVERATLRGHTAWKVFASSDGTVKVWDAATSRWAATAHNPETSRGDSQWLII